MGNSVGSEKLDTQSVEKYLQQKRERQLRTLDEERLRLIGQFDSQRLVLLGSQGSGKSSIVNSFNFLVNSAVKDSRYAEVAEMGTGGIRRTRRLRSHSSKTKMYSYILKDQDLKVSAEKGPFFYDTTGIDQKYVKEILVSLIKGQIEENFDMLKLLIPNVSSEEETKLINKIKEEILETRKTNFHDPLWGIIFVVSAPYVKSVGFPQRMATDLHAAVTSDSDLLENVRFFVAVTKYDELQKEDREEVMRTVISNSEISFQIQSHRVFPISNYTTKDRKGEYGHMDQVYEKNVLLTRAFLEILGEWHQPRKN